LSKINISEWKEYQIKELFDITPTRYHKLINKDLIDENGINPVIVNSSYNNGVGGYSYLECTEIGNIITFSDTTTAESIFYQPIDFVGYSHVQKLTPILYHENWTKNCLLFFMVIFRKQASLMDFNYVNKFTREMALNLNIKLPVKNDIPDWEYMENFIYNIHKKEISNQYYITQYIDRSQSKKIDLSNWRKFHLYDKGLFEIDMGTKLDKVKMTQQNPTVNFIGRANKNNGITEYVDLINDINPYEAGNLTLSLGGEYLGSCFIQPSPFYTSQNVIVLKPTWDMSFNVKMFISIMVFRESRQFYKAFIDELNRHVKTDFSIYLPIDKAGEPDWEYMEQFIDNLYDKEREKIKVILSIH